MESLLEFMAFIMIAFVLHPWWGCALLLLLFFGIGKVFE